MIPEEERQYLDLCEKEGWQIRKKPTTSIYDRGQANYEVIVGEHTLPLGHPYQIHLTLYRRIRNPEQKFQHMKAVHDYLWPHHIITWNYWQERRFRAHCGSYKYITLAGGANIGKSMDAAKIALIFWLANPKNRAAIIASVTLDSLESRIWGYVLKLLDQAALPVPANYMRSKPPKILYPYGREVIADRISGMFANAIRSGDDDKTISTVIGRHPDDGVLIILDECTDMPLGVLKARVNLIQNKWFQFWGIGNSNSIYDLHGVLSTPKVGWDKIDPKKDYIWETTQDDGICLYFNPYDSPAIHEKDPARKAALSNFLITEHGTEDKPGIKDLEENYGANTAEFYRFGLGFWQSRSGGSTIASQQFLNEQEIMSGTEWSGFYPLHLVAGLDSAFAVGSTGCVLRFGLMGQTSMGKIVMDFREEEMIFRINTRPTESKSPEYQVASQVIELLKRFGCSVGDLTIDATGAGRAIGELIRVMANSDAAPILIHSSPNLIGGLRKKKDNPHLHVTTPTEIWFTFGKFVNHKQIRGLDQKSVQQIVNRRKIVDDKTKKERIENKDEYKLRMAAIDPKLAHSPDEADASMLCVYGAILRYGFAPGQVRDVPTDGGDQMWQQKFFVYAREMLAKQALLPQPGKPRLGSPKFACSLEENLERRR